MSVKKLLFVFGTRPEAIKMSPIIKKFQSSPSRYDVKICVTAQHRQMLDQVLELFDLEPDFDLDLMRPNQDLYDITSNVLLGLRDVLKDYCPDLIFVHGDTTTSFSASMAAFYQKIDVAHIEAGLRTNTIYSPFPEEINRQLTSRIAKYHFSPTCRSRENLIKEGINAKNIFVTGNSVIDALLDVVAKNKGKNLHIDGYTIGEREYVLVTGHRRENFGVGFANICAALKTIALMFPEIDIVYPVHLNPNVQQVVKDCLEEIDNVFLIKPQEYESFVYLMSRCHLILTDSGGIQEEAPSLGKPVLVMRESTERPEAIDAKTVKLVGVSQAAIVGEVTALLESQEKYEAMSRSHNPYGDGMAAQKVFDIVESI